MGKKEEKIAEVWSQYNEVLRDRQELEKEARALKKREEGLEGELGALVPEGEVKGGIEHRVSEKPSVKYAKVYERIVKELVPKTKAGKAEEIKAAFTSKTPKHTFKEV